MSVNVYMELQGAVEHAGPTAVTATEMVVHVQFDYLG